VAVDQRILEIVLRYEELIAQGQGVTAEELCRDCPELLDEVRRRTAGLRALAPLLRSDSSTAGSSTVDRVANLAGSLSESGSGAAPPHRYPQIPGYEILEMLGRGGMGVVYKARHLALKRLVALKMIRAGEDAAPEELARFRTEAEAVARLQHPNIVQVHEIGEHGGRQFICLEFVGGGSLAEKLGGEPMAAGLAAALAHTLAQAVAAAHRAGVVHRDLKPGNVLLTEDGRPKVADFGLAKRLDEDAGQTRTRAVLGTPSYMAPEQAAGRIREVGPGTDVYALGAMLYKMLTGRPPFQAATTLDTLEQVRSQEPVSPRRLQPKVTRDLETICLKCLEKEPGRRYGSAEALAEDLGRFVAGEPVRARPVGNLGRVVKWARRRPAVAGLLVLLVLVTVFGFAAVAWQLQETQAALADVQLARDAEGEQTKIAEAASGKAKEKAREAAEKAAAEEKARKKMERTVYYQQIALADRQWLTNQVAQADQLLNQCDPRFRQWEWRYLRRLCHSDLLTIPACDAVAYCPTGKRLAAITNDIYGYWAAHIFDAATGQHQLSFVGHNADVVHLAFSPGGKLLATASKDKTVKLWDTFAGKEVRTLKGHGDSVVSVVFSPDGKQLASGSHDKTVKVWDVATGQATLTLRGHTDRVTSVAFSAGGKRLVSGSHDKTLKVWDTVTGRQIISLNRHVGEVLSVAFSPNGKRVASAGTDMTVLIWDAANGRQVLSLPGHSAVVQSISFSPDGRRLASASEDQTVRIWDAGRGTALFTLRGHSGPVGTVVFSPDGERIASASSMDFAGHHEIKVWNSVARQEAIVLTNHSSWVYAVAFSADGRHLASASADGSAKVWVAATGQEVRSFAGHSGMVYRVAFNPGGKSIASANWNYDRGKKEWTGSEIKVWEVATGQTLARFGGHQGLINAVAFSPDGKRLASASEDGSAKILDPASGRLLLTIPAKKNMPVKEVAFSPDGRRLALALAHDVKGYSLSVCDATTGKEQFFCLGHAGLIYCVAFSPDGRRIASGGEDRTAKVWDAATGKELVTCRGHTSALASVAFSSDGMRIATASYDQTVKIWDTLTGEEVLSLRGHLGPVYGVRFSSKGHRLASASDKVRIWDARPLAEPVVLGRSIGNVFTVAWHPNGRRLASGATDLAIRLWETRTEKELLCLRGHTNAINKVVFTPDGRRLISASGDGSIRYWDAAEGKGISSFQAHIGHVADMALIQKGTRLVSAGFDDKKVIIWDMQSRQVLRTLEWPYEHHRGFDGLAASEDGRFIAASCLPGLVRVWNGRTGQRLFTVQHEGIYLRRSLAFSPDGDRLATASDDRTVKIWDTATGRLLLTFRGHWHWCWGVVFSPDGRRIASTSADGTVKIWDPNTGHELATLVGHTNRVQNAAFSPDGKKLASAAYDGTVRVWNLEEWGVRGR
jgi:WD40 repeat protein